MSSIQGLLRVVEVAEPLLLHLERVDNRHLQGFRVWDLGFGVWEIWSRNSPLESRVNETLVLYRVAASTRGQRPCFCILHSLMIVTYRSMFSVWSLGFGVWGLGFGV